MVDLSIIIVSYNTADLTTQCLESIERSISRFPVNLEIVIIDNASTDNSIEVLKGFKLQATSYKLIENKSNLGFGKANNLGLTKAKGKYVLFLNSDTIVDKVNFRELIQMMDDDEKIGVLTVRVNLESGKLDQASHRGFPTIWRSFTYFSKLEYLTKRIPLLNRLFGGYHLTHLNLTRTHEIDSPSGAFFLTRKSILDKVGGFDEAFFMYGEDLDLAKRIKEAGYKTIFYPGQSIIHLKGKSGLKQDNLKTKKKTSHHFYDAMRIFYDKHYAGKYPPFLNLIIHWLISLRTKN